MNHFAGYPVTICIQADQPALPGRPVEIRPGEIYVFRGFGIPQAAVQVSRPVQLMTHAPGRMPVTDHRDAEFQISY